MPPIHHNAYLEVFYMLLFFTSCHGQQQYQKLPIKLNKCLYNELGFIQEIFLPNTMMANNVSSLFSLKLRCPTRLPHCMRPCPTEKFTMRIPIINQDSKFQFTPGGFLKIESNFYDRDEFCIFDKTRTSVIIEACKPDCGRNTICVPKCCSADKVLDINLRSCQYSLEKQWKPLLHKSEDVQVCGEKRDQTKFHYYQSIPTCDTSQPFFLKSFKDSDEDGGKSLRVQFRLLQNGSVIMKEIQSHDWKLLKQGEYCLDGIQNYGSQLGPYSGDPIDQVIIACNPDENYGTETNSTKFNKLTATGIAYSILLFSGTPFLLMTVIVYILVWNKQNVHGWALFSHTLAMLLNYTGQGVTNTVTRVYDSRDNASTSCKVIGILNHYFVLASFCWMTMINYDLWSMFRHLQNTIGKSRGIKRFTIYSVIAWGVPLFVVFISVILDEEYGLYGEDGDECEHDQIIIPLYGFKTCYMVEEARPYYLFYPIGSLMMINLILTALTFYNMSIHKQSAKMIAKKSTKHKRKFSVWSKLFIVMGVAYTSEVVVWNLKEKDITLPWYLVFPDVLSLFQAIAIFILFACQPKIINQLNEAYPFLDPFLNKVKHLPCYAQK